VKLTRVVHCKKSPYDVYIGRPSKWGNPFVIGRDGTRTDVIWKYETRLLNRPDMLADLQELEGKTLGCWCHPLPCHGDVLARLCNKMKLPDIAISSYLGSSKRIRRRRLEMHLQQRVYLAECFPRLDIVSLCSGYPEKYRTAMEPWKCWYLDDKPVLKYRKHNTVLECLYREKQPRAVLLIDDDVVPVRKKDKLPHILDAVKLIKQYILDPESMPASMIHFSCEGHPADLMSYYPSDTPDIVECPLHICGWSMMVRNDHGVVYDPKYLTTPEGYVLDDTPFRVYCASLGKHVAKHNRVLFKSYQKLSFDKDKKEETTLYENHGQRLEEQKAHDRNLARLYPKNLYWDKKEDKLRVKKPFKGIRFNKPLARETEGFGLIT
jgi:hypothetical protein